MKHTNFNIVFCFPYKGVGGVSLLFLRLAERLAEEKRYKVKVSIVDYVDGYMAKNKRNQNVTLIPYYDKGSVNLPENSIVVFQSMSPWSIFPSLEFSSTNRLFFWTCHPFNLVPTFPGLRYFMFNYPYCGKFFLNTILYGYKKKIIRMIQIALSKNALVFMDTVTLKNTMNYLGVSISDPVFVPIPAYSIKRKKLNAKRIDSKGLRVIWIGRIVDFKFYILKYTLENLNLVSEQVGFPIHFTVVGSGEFKTRIQEIGINLKNIEIKYIDHINPDDLDRFLSENFDLVMSMGTSALEGAKLGIPTILLDLSYKEIKGNYRFQWLYERKGYTLGDVISEEHFELNNNSLLNRIQELDHSYMEVSKKTYEYFYKNHEISKVTKSFYDKVLNSNLTYHDFQALGIMKRDLFYKSFVKLRNLFQS